MNIVNFSHPLTDKQRTQIETLVQRSIDEIIPASVQFDTTQSFVDQLLALIDSLPISAERWQTDQWLIVLPSLNYIAAILLAELHGRIGYFPTIIRLRPVPNALVTEYEVGEIVNLQTIREEARTHRQASHLG